MSVKEIVENSIKPIIDELGYELVEVTYLKEFSGMTLTVVIDTEREGGINLNDCETVSKNIDKILDELNPTSDVPYTLNVSSPGLDRPLKTERDFIKNKGKEIEIALYKKYNNKKKYTGILVDYDEESVTIVNNEKQKFLRSDITVIKPVIKF